MAVTAGLAAVTGLWTTYILRKFVPMLKNELVFADYAEPAQIPRNSGGYVARWNIPQKFNGSTTVITEASAGTVGERTNTTITAVEATISTYGEFMKVGEIAEMSQITGALDVYGEQFMYAGEQAIDSLIKAVALTTTNVYKTGGGVGTGTLTASTTATVRDFPKIAAFFRAGGAKGHESLKNDFVWIIHPDQETNILTENTSNSLSWSQVNQNVPAGYEQLINNHRFVGRYAGVTAIRTAEIGTSTADVTAYASVALARWGVGWLGLGETGPTAPSIKIKRPGPSDTSQPLDLYMTIGWKFKAVARLLDVARVLKVYSSV